MVARYRSSKGRWRIRAYVRRIKRIRVKGAVLMAERRWGAQSSFDVRQGFFVVNSNKVWKRELERERLESDDGQGGGLGGSRWGWVLQVKFPCRQLPERTGPSERLGLMMMGR